MRLLDLPGELIDEIINYTCPDGLESFALSCKAVYQRAYTQMEKHNALRTQWQHTRNDTTARYADSLRILSKICAAPRIGWYIEQLDLWDKRVGVEGEVVDDFREDSEVMERVRSAVRASSFLRDAGVDADEWWEKITVEDDDGADPDDWLGTPFTDVFLLSLLPNLRELQLYRGTYFGPVQPPPNDEVLLVKVLDAIVARANSDNEDGGEKALGKLRTILPFLAEGYEERAPLQCLEPFLRLHSLQELFGVSLIAVEDGYTGVPFSWLHPGQISYLKRIELAYCCMDSEGIWTLLSRTPHLTSFAYSHQSKWHGCEHNWNAGAFIEAIARTVGPTLTSLAITVDLLRVNIINGASSFHSFPQLQHLEIGMQVFYGPPVESGQERGINLENSDGTLWTENDIPCLGSMLPDLIRTCDLNTDFDSLHTKALDSLLKNIKEERTQRLKELECVTVRQWLHGTAQPQTQRAEVNLEIYRPPRLPENEEGTILQHSMMPAWKRKFSERVGGLMFNE
ncbi:hypothetical protein GQ43DRAFT_391657 [Delitschia confertaspora ATCC 74209]|uniref:F-box domain-containing protein n=1 Tax=Delitschia confertaspora ATCC 74209 TaxID=1513339 RepID=A0A9P4JNT6_9PLEO|nr:hypothetical protein GQ43DRAFT_391657 [Delitschia confertaspora ATCC 74209]